jgi:alkanesulfonate monooxygenase SsuD/methylene tetrahydromethanopterin reductase-like flavin-dependent oxidoreductase (luciferase family)
MIAGERGFIPMSLALNSDYCRSHWEAIEEGAQRTGRTPSRADWRLVRDVYVADTDEEARDLALNGMLGRVWHDYLLPLFREFDLMKVFKHDDEVPDDAVNIEYMADHLWLIGSPDTVAGKIRDLYQDVGGFGGLLMLVYDQSENNAAWEHSTRLLAENVMPQVSDLTGKNGV